MEDSAFAKCCNVVDQEFASCQKTRVGKVFPNIPQSIDEDSFAVCIYSVNGKYRQFGDWDLCVCCQSVIKVFSLCLAYDQVGIAALQRKVGFEGDSRPFNVLALNSSGIPINPCRNDGALVVTELLMTAFGGRFAEVTRLLAQFFGEQLAVDYDTFTAEKVSTRNFELCRKLREEKCILAETDEQCDQVVDNYLRLCALKCSTRGLAHAAATLTAGGLSPSTGCRVASPLYVMSCHSLRAAVEHFTFSACRTSLTVMQNCGLYDSSGQFAVKVGIPSKSGISGAFIAAVHRSSLGMAIVSPRLDKHGSSVRALQLCEVLSKRLRLHVFAVGEEDELDGLHEQRRETDALDDDDETVDPSSATVHAGGAASVVESESCLDRHANKCPICICILITWDSTLPCTPELWVPDAQFPLELADRIMDVFLLEVRRRMMRFRAPISAPPASPAALSTAKLAFRGWKWCFASPSSMIEHIHTLQTELIERSSRQADNEIMIRDLKLRLHETEAANKRLRETPPDHCVATLQEELISVKMREAEANLSLKEIRQRLAELESHWAQYMSERLADTADKSGASGDAAQPAESPRKPSILERLQQRAAPSPERSNESASAKELEDQLMGLRISEADTLAELKEMRQKLMELETQNKEQSVMVRLREADLLQTIADLKSRVAELESKRTERWTTAQLMGSRYSVQSIDEPDMVPASPVFSRSHTGSDAASLGSGEDFGALVAEMSMRVPPDSPLERSALLNLDDDDDDEPQTARRASVSSGERTVGAVSDVEPSSRLANGAPLTAA